MSIDRTKFFAGIRQQPFPGKLTAGQVSGTSAILDEWDRRKLTDLRHLFAGYSPGGGNGGSGIIIISVAR